MSVCVSVCLSVCQSASLSVRLSVCLSVCLSVRQVLSLHVCSSASTNCTATEGAGSELIISIMHCSICKKFSKHNDVVTHTRGTFVKAHYACRQKANGGVSFLQSSNYIAQTCVLRHCRCLYTYL